MSLWVSIDISISLLDFFKKEKLGTRNWDKWAINGENYLCSFTVTSIFWENG